MKKMTFEDIYTMKEALSSEDILQALSDLGHCPSLINDDDGGWVISEDGIQNIPDKSDQPLNTCFLIEAPRRPTIREAVIDHLERIKKEVDEEEEENPDPAKHTKTFKEKYGHLKERDKKFNNLIERDKKK